MPCFYPKQCWHGKEFWPSGKRKLVFTEKQAYQPDVYFHIPCRRCQYCKIKAARSKSIQCIHEAEQHEDNCFITLTYAPENLPKGGSLHYEHMRDFIKRLRKHVWRYEDDRKIKYFYGGEYGEKTFRPHYHALLFNYDFPDKEPLTMRKNHVLYKSDLLSRLWPHGHSSVGSLTFESAGYVARYCMKKIHGDDANDHYKSVDKETGEVFDLVPEKCISSKYLGKDWFDKYWCDVYGDVYSYDYNVRGDIEHFVKDFITFDGNSYAPSRAYDQWFEKSYPEQFELVKEVRAHRALKLEDDDSYNLDRLRVKEKVFANKINRLVRNLEISY